MGSPSLRQLASSPHSPTTGEKPVEHQRPRRVKKEKESARNAGDLSSIPGSGRYSEGANSNPLRYSCLGNPTEEPGGLQSMGLQRIGHD